MKKLKLHGETAYILATALLSLAVAMVAAADFGISMVVAPAYVLSLYMEWLSFGQAEYVVQGILFIAFCIIMRRFRISYLFAFISCLIYGLALDLWRKIPIFDPTVTAPGSMDTWLRVLFFVVGELITAFAVALYFFAYFPPQVNDYFVKGVSERYNIKKSLFKTCFDIGSLVIAVIMSFCFFGVLKGVGWGTLVITLVNGALIGLCSGLLDKAFEPSEFFPKLKEYFEK